jgi:hypothetical protein
LSVCACRKGDEILEGNWNAIEEARIHEVQCWSSFENLEMLDTENLEWIRRSLGSDLQTTGSKIFSYAAWKSEKIPKFPTGTAT